MFYVYVIQSLKNSRFYVGSTNDLKRRIHDHNRGKNRSARGQGPFKLIYKEEISSRLEATRRERVIKSYKGGNAFIKLINQKDVDPIV